VLDRDTFEALYRDQEKRLFNVAYRWTWNRAEAHELVQEAFLRMWTRRAFIDAERAAAYAARSVVNLCRKRARRARRWQRVRAALQLAPPESRTPPRCYENDSVRRAIESLPDVQRHVLLLTEFTDLKQHEIAELLDIRPGTVASRRNRALAALKENLNE
jgi:RNA polymerase sigma-70 factor (ECF subfamily)